MWNKPNNSLTSSLVNSWTAISSDNYSIVLAKNTCAASKSETTVASKLQKLDFAGKTGNRETFAWSLHYQYEFWWTKNAIQNAHKVAGHLASDIGIRDHQVGLSHCFPPERQRSRNWIGYGSVLGFLIGYSRVISFQDIEHLSGSVRSCSSLWRTCRGDAVHSVLVPL